MRKVIFTFVLLALIAPLAAADTAPEATATVTAVSVAAEPVPAEETPEVDLQEIFADFGEGMEPHEKKLCPIDAPGDCTRDFDCELLYGPNPCDGGNGQWTCAEPHGRYLQRHLLLLTHACSTHSGTGSILNRREGAGPRFS